MKHSYTLLIALVLLVSLSACHVEVINPYDPRDAFVGTYDVEEYSETYWETTYYGVDIYKSSYEPNVVWIDNFYGIGLEVAGQVDGTRLRIPPQRIGDYDIEGQGYLDGNGNVQLFFTLVERRFFNDRVDNCDAVFYAVW